MNKKKVNLTIRLNPDIPLQAEAIKVFDALRMNTGLTMSDCFAVVMVRVLNDPNLNYGELVGGVLSPIRSQTQHEIGPQNEKKEGNLMDEIFSLQNSWI